MMKRICVMLLLAVVAAMLFLQPVYADIVVDPTRIPEKPGEFELNPFLIVTGGLTAVIALASLSVLFGIKKKRTSVDPASRQAER